MSIPGEDENELCDILIYLLINYETETISEDKHCFNFNCYDVEEGDWEEWGKGKDERRRGEHGTKFSYLTSITVVVEISDDIMLVQPSFIASCLFHD